MRKLANAILMVFLAVSLNLSAVQFSNAAPSAAGMTMSADMGKMAMADEIALSLKSGDNCKYCADMSDGKAITCGPSCPNLGLADIALERGFLTFVAIPFTSLQVLLTGRAFAPETGPPRTFALI